MIAGSQTGPRILRLNPFSLLSDTGFRFALLIFSVIAASLFIYGYIYLTIPANFKALNATTQAYETAVAAHTTDSDADIQARIEAEEHYLIPSDRTEAVWIIGCVILEFSLALVIFLVLPRWKIWRSHLRPLDASAMPEIVTYLANLCQGVGLSRFPKFLWQPFSSAKTGLAFGCFGWYYVALPAGLVKQFYTDRATFHIVVLHELAHLGNKDVDKTYFTISLWWAFVISAIVPIIPITVYSLYLDISLFSLSPAALFATSLYHTGFTFTWHLIAFTLVVYLTRNAVLRVREVYADARASIWDGHRDRLTHILESFPCPKGGDWQRPLRVHPDPGERLQILKNTSRLFYVGFWEALGAGITVMLALPSIVNLLYLLHIGGANFTEQEVAFIGAGLIIAPFLAGFLSLGIWRVTFLHLAGDIPPRSIVHLGSGLIAGMLIGQALSLQDYLNVLSYYTNNFILSLSFDIFWSLLLLVSMILFLQWVSTCVSAWLEVAATDSSPRLIYWSGLIFTSGVLAVWLSQFYWIRYTTLAVPYQPGPGGITTLVSGLAGNILIPVENPTFPFSLIIPMALLALWAYPLVSWFWRRRVATSTAVSWLFLESPQRLVLPQRLSFRIGYAALASLIGALVFCILRIIMRIVVSLVVSEAVRATPGFYNPYGTSQIILAIVLEFIVAAVVARKAQPLGSIHAIFAAFIAGCLMTIGNAVVGLIFVNPLPDIASIWIAIQAFFGFVVNGGVILALPIAFGVSILAKGPHGPELQIANSASLETISSSITTQSVGMAHPLNIKLPGTTKVLLIGLILLATISSGTGSIFYALRNNLVFPATAQPTITTQPTITAAPVISQIPYSNYRGKLILDESLNNNTHNRQWDEGTGCTFTGGAYHVAQNQPELSRPCIEHGIYIHNFVYEVQMKITTSADSGIGGIIFRADAVSSTFYDFVIGLDGSYALERFDANSNGIPTTLLEKCCSPAINKGQNRVNVLAIVASGDVIELYVNHQKIASAHDRTYSTGSFGFIVVAINKPTEAVYNNARVWML